MALCQDSVVYLAHLARLHVQTSWTDAEFARGGATRGEEKRNFIRARIFLGHIRTELLLRSRMRGMPHCQHSAQRDRSHKRDAKELLAVQRGPS